MYSNTSVVTKSGWRIRDTHGTLLASLTYSIIVTERMFDLSLGDLVVLRKPIQLTRSSEVMRNT